MAMIAQCAASVRREKGGAGDGPVITGGGGIGTRASMRHRALCSAIAAQPARRDGVVRNMRVSRETVVEAAGVEFD